MEQNTALLVMDMQAGTLRNLADPAPVVANVARAIAIARENGIPVIYVVVGFRQGAPEISNRNKIFAAAKERLAGVNMDDYMKIHPQLAPQPGELVVTKRRISAFTGSDLEVVLRSLSISHLVLAGIATGGVVLSTTREAADKDFNLTILQDGCTDADKEVHHVLVTKILPRQANVLTVEEWGKQYT
jgi:nicotinamidase-related amidase